jgi:ABC-type branched-subunit amino acid transport system substrate-binding protein
VFYDNSPDELYSPNLAKDFQTAFTRDGGRGAVRMLPYTEASGIPQKVLQACQHPPDVFYFAGRSDEFQPFVQQLSTTECGSGRRTVLAGDDVTKYVSDNAVRIGRIDGLRLYYTPLAAREAWEQRRDPQPTFYGDYDTVVAELQGNTAVHPSRTHAAVAYDAVLMVTTITKRLYGAQRQTLPTAGAVLAALAEPDTDAPPPQGASGLLRFGPQRGGHAVPDKPVMLMAVGKDGKLRVEAVCGKLTKSDDSAQSPRCPAQAQ